MKFIQFVILGQGTPIHCTLPADDNFVITSSQGNYRASNIYRVEVDWEANETLLYTPGAVIEFSTAPIGAQLLETIKSGEQQFQAPTQSAEGEIQHDDD